MGKALSLMTKPIREFNIESRAHAVISKEKPTAAPKYKADQLNYERLLRDHPEVFEESLRKNEQLDKHLRDVFLKSYDPLVKDKIESSDVNPEKPLPTARTTAEEFEYGFYEPKRITLGKTTLRKAMRFISEHHKDAKINNVTKISEEYLLPEETVKNILKYFLMFELYIPKERQVKATFAGPVVPRKQIRTQTQRVLGSSVKNKKDVGD